MYGSSISGYLIVPINLNCYETWSYRPGRTYMLKVFQNKMLRGLIRLVKTPVSCSGGLRLDPRHRV